MPASVYIIEGITGAGKDTICNRLKHARRIAVSKGLCGLGIDPNTGENVDNGVSGTEATRYLTERIKARGARV